ncbi:hypothetical protein RQM47_08880 [Rubrivirga sp. S365]|uniref:Uncharacterized protein n=1 Tax=Rubrivirga litoralis TaxID=3075598 RepID=A0ABU3BTF1_9BACT|nr:MULTISPECIES: hypothetical protein [unclassified Rubrivirga]MDT0632560.1 hypothetical protein [Rubrivirga sp. F394]MDT7856752.1 hypothetical protein [Rubrivirga sp. S365]
MSETAVFHDDVSTGLTAEDVSDLVARSVSRDSAPSFQALLAASVTALERTAEPLEVAEASALNLAQREHVADVAADVEAVVAALRSGVSAEARCLAPAPPTAAQRVRSVLRPAPGWLPRLRERAGSLAMPAPPPTRPWVTAAAAAVGALGQTAEHLALLGAAQPAESSARMLADRLAARLRAHRDTLLADVARVVD